MDLDTSKVVEIQLVQVNIIIHLEWMGIIYYFDQ